MVWFKSQRQYSQMQTQLPMAPAISGVAGQGGVGDTSPADIGIIGGRARIPLGMGLDSIESMVVGWSEGSLAQTGQAGQLLLVTGK